MQGPSSEAQSQPQTSEMFAQLSTSQQPPQNRSANDAAQHLAGFLQQQGVLPGGINLADPAAQAHVFHILSQLPPQVWGGNLNQASNSQALESVLAQISRQPEIAASIPSILNSLAGQQQQAQQHKPDGTAPAPLDGGQGSYTAQLYGNSGPGMAPDSDKLDGSAELGATPDQDPAMAKANSVKCAKEKNRQAQRRFRERQKGLIQALKERADALQKQVEDQRRQIETLEKENQVLKVILQEKNKA